MNNAYLSQYDKDCLSFSLAELVAKYPNIAVEQLKSDKKEIEEVCCELNQRRFLKWLGKNKRYIWRF